MRTSIDENLNRGGANNFWSCQPMTKSGRGVLLVITDAAPEFEAEFNEWYDREHLKDRVATAGFLSARRYVASDAVRKYLAVYETESIAVFESPRLQAEAGRADRLVQAYPKTIPQPAPCGRPDRRQSGVLRRWSSKHRNPCGRAGGRHRRTSRKRGERAHPKAHGPAGHPCRTSIGE